ncbi:MAG: hypothetical protein A4E40_01018 [Methanoregulaceae archaeon PtaU1.Bin059]|jgi:predicted DNA-binding protein (UPF0251 family)|nr:MAG: hypothetical protein A4E36_01652 [Methanoregulaceae archaeon PtaB.Bin009]OPY39718.1 MAG: hypothetical protein A4E40_01018 [Methanoregulaceae archaeon PtaU1.Bin059]HII76822.1 DUF134 domain-containing protein [Methanolinea sp.]HNQ30749.1 DUF134 domain-containing protein [Methanolinea sp.]
MCPDNQGENPHRGRPRIRRKFGKRIAGRCFEPCNFMGGTVEEVILRQDELEILRLIDIEGLSQEEAAGVMGISRRTLWRDLQETRRKCAEALIFGKKITLDRCAGNARGWCRREMNGETREDPPDTRDEM